MPCRLLHSSCKSVQSVFQQSRSDQTGSQSQVTELCFRLHLGCGFYYTGNARLVKLACYMEEAMTEWAEVEKKYYMATFKRLPVVLVRGAGNRVWDENGKEYLDFFGGLAVNALGHCHPVMIEALNKQAGILIHTTNLFYTIPQLQLAELLVQNSCLDKVFFSNSGAEANEGAIKVARKYGHIHRNNAYEIITVTGSFHGRTLATIAATGQQEFQDPFVPLPTGFINVQYDDIDAIRNATNDLTCAVMLEPIQGEGGVNLPSVEYFAQVRDWCDRNDLLLIFDEVQTGIGRTGTLFAYEQLGVEPDVMTLAKGLGGGFPVGAILAKEKASVFAPGDHGSTFGGNPLACAVGYAILKFILENGLVENTRQTGQYLLSRLAGLKAEFGFITEARGRGFLCALAFDRDVSADVVQACLEKGLLILVCGSYGNVVRVLAPFVITDEQLEKGLSIMEAGLKEISKGDLRNGKR